MTPHQNGNGFPFEWFLKGIPAIVGQTTIQRSDGNSCKRVTPLRVKSASKSLKLIRWFTSSLKATQILYDSSFGNMFQREKNYLKPSTPSCGISYTVDCLHPHLLVLALRGEIWENCSSDLVKNLVSRRSAWILSSENFGFLCFVSHGLSSSQPPKRWTLPRSTARGEPRGGFFPLSAM